MATAAAGVKDVSSTAILTSSIAPSLTLQAYEKRCTARTAAAAGVNAVEKANTIARNVARYELLLNKVAYCVGVLAFGLFCYLLGSRPEAIPQLYCAFFILAAPLRWLYYRSKKWHYYLLDFCYYANAILVCSLLFFPSNKRLLMLCFAFSEGPLAWALIVWRCSLVFSSVDKLISVLIHLLPGTVLFILRWWTSSSVLFSASHGHSSAAAAAPAATADDSWLWLFLVPLMAYFVWQMLYVAVVGCIRRQRVLGDPQIMTSYRELKRRAERAENVWWRVSGAVGEEHRVWMYGMMQAAFSMASFAFTIHLFHNYALHAAFQLFKVMTTLWFGATFMFDVAVPRRSSS